MARAVLAELAAGEPVSGAALARRLGLTRAAIWKHVGALRESGLPIRARTGVGYCLPWPVQLLDAHDISRRLQWPERAPVHLLWTVDSTQDEIARHQDAWPDLTVVLAEQQTRGRGRRARSWQSPPALGIQLSCLKRFDTGPAALSGLSLAVGVCTVRALESAGARGLRLKWPNDVMSGQGKLAGILIELGGEAEGPTVARVGMGVNVRLPGKPSAAPIPGAAALAAPGSAPPAERNALAAALIDSVRAGLRRFEAEGLAPFARDFERLDCLRDRAVAIHAANGSREGTARGIDSRGALLVEIGGALTAVQGGEVSVRARA